MSTFSYDELAFPVRADIGDAHRAYWQKLAEPGTWWSGEERVAIAREARAARDCKFCRQRKQALSPYTGEAAHESVTDLSPLAIDAIHRVMTDQNRITRQYIKNNEAEGLSKQAYVELVGIVVAMISIDEFNRGLGASFEALPEPRPGEPTHYLPEHVTDDTGFVPMLKRDGALGNEDDLWEGNRTANVLRALTLVPNAFREWRSLGEAHYLSFEAMADFVGAENRAIDRAQTELIAGRVSSYNECFY